MPSFLNAHPTSVLIRKLDSIRAISEVERQALQSLPVKIQILGARQDIVREGDEPSQCCLILDGWVCRYKLLSEGRRQILSFHLPGEIPDFQSLHLPTMDHNLATMKQATIALIPHKSLRKLTVEFPDLGSLLWKYTLIDAAIFRAWMAGMGRRTAYERIAHLFCEIYLKLQALGLAESYCCPMPVTQTDLADALGLTSVHVNRVLMEMRGKAMITLRSSTLIINAWDELLRASEFDPAYLHLEKRAAA